MWNYNVICIVALFLDFDLCVAWIGIYTLRNLIHGKDGLVTIIQNKNSSIDCIVNFGLVHGAQNWIKNLKWKDVGPLGMSVVVSFVELVSFCFLVDKTDKLVGN